MDNSYKFFISKYKMKKFTIFIFIVIFLYGCKKDPFDYRSKFIGDYNFVIHAKTSYGIQGNMYNFDTTYTYPGKIDFGPNENTIQISYPDLVYPVLYEDGTMSGNGYRGEFESENKINLTFGFYSPGGGTTYTITGEKYSH
jgi:hypothetical protein